MKRLVAMTLGLMLVAAVAHSADPQAVSTGDRKMDSILRAMNTEAKADPDGLVNRLSTMFNFPEQEIRQARDAQGLDPAGLYMSAALARVTQRPVLVVAEDYKKNEGKGWGVLAREMGIKPGSRAFHELKRGGQGCLDHMRADARAKQKHEKQMGKEHGRKMKGEPGEKGEGRPH
jgi:hypothetical protein